MHLGSVPSTLESSSGESSSGGGGCFAVCLASMSSSCASRKLGNDCFSSFGASCSSSSAPSCPHLLSARSSAARALRPRPTECRSPRAGPARCRPHSSVPLCLLPMGCRISGQCIDCAAPRARARRPRSSIAALVATVVRRPRLAPPQRPHDAHAPVVDRRFRRRCTQGIAAASRGMRLDLSDAKRRKKKKNKTYIIRDVT
jgi:hypothetical protein